jgi:pyruvate/2-oxoglutarate dehydrogenase complex dihydrolipoamide dehydrogenase (E3) component
VTDQFDAIIVGAGQAGPALAARLTASGQKVALVERHLIGGTCVNTGCMPTKALVASAYAAHLARRAADFGVRIDGSIDIDMKAVAARVGKVTTDARTRDEQWLASIPGLTVIRGHARFVAPGLLHVDGADLKSSRIFLNVGGRALIPDMPGLNEVSYLTNSTIVGLDVLPDHLIIVGGSYIGLEFAQIYRRFGSQVTVVERGDRLISHEDAEVSDAVRGILEAEGIAVRSGADCLRIEARANGVAVGVNCTAGPPEIEGSHVLMAVGRRPNTDDLGLELGGIATDARGYIQVDDALATTAEGVWALGDCNGRGAFTHTAWNDYEIVAANLLDGESRKVSDRLLGYALYVDPPLGRAGMTLAQAKESGRPLLLAKRSMKRVGRAVEKGETHGFMSLIADAETKKILGAAILGVGGDEAIHGVLDMMNADQTISALQWAMPIHPTVSELLPTLAGSLVPVDEAPR